eukprot:TRINITY_DN19734_c0_g1_i1.p1 TRINITY_DN19734_c0_g1~~TRINITY_DN19734_c0_g1_i1.p1  ORF type:complete len:682 (+),score=201.78 TRINITY_DN19734_c0_g1_i1:58-2046(+)
MVGWGSSAATTLFDKLGDDALEAKYSKKEVRRLKLRKREQAKPPVAEAADPPPPVAQVSLAPVQRGSCDWRAATQQVEHFIYSSDTRYVVVPDAVEKVVYADECGAGVDTDTPILPPYDAAFARVRTPNLPGQRAPLPRAQAGRPATQQGTRKPGLKGMERALSVGGGRQKWGGDDAAKHSRSSRSAGPAKGVVASAPSGPVDDMPAQDDSAVFKIVGGSASQCLAWCREGVPATSGPCGEAVYLPFVNRGNADAPLDTLQYTNGGLALLVCAVDIQQCRYITDYAHPAAAGPVSCVVADNAALVVPKYLVHCRRDVASGLRQAVLAHAPPAAEWGREQEHPSFLNCPVHPTCPLDVVSVGQNELLCAMCVASGGGAALPVGTAVSSFQDKVASVHDAVGSLASHFRGRLKRLGNAKVQSEARTAYLLETIERKQMVLIENVNVCAREAKKAVRGLHDRALHPIERELAHAQQQLASMEALQKDSVRLRQSLAGSRLTAQCSIPSRFLQDPAPTHTHTHTDNDNDAARQHVLSACGQQSRFSAVVKELDALLEATVTTLQEAGAQSVAAHDGLASNTFCDMVAAATDTLVANHPISNCDVYVQPLAANEVVSANAELKLCAVAGGSDPPAQPPPPQPVALAPDKRPPARTRRSIALSRLPRQ